MEDKNELITLTGTFTYILFRNDENMYTVAKFKVQDVKEKNVTVTGLIPRPETNTMYTLSGTYIEHPRYGMQFQVVSITKNLPSGKEGVIRYLSGPAFAGIGKKTASRIVESLGEDCLAMIREDPDCIRLVPGISEKHIEAVLSGLKNDQEGPEELMRFINVNGIGYRNLIRLNQRYGAQAVEKLKENPYRVIEECDGFGFITADKIAKSLGVEDDDERRLYAILITCASDLCFSLGNSYVRYEALEEYFQSKTRGIEASFDDLLQKALLTRSLIREEDRIYPAVQYDAEVSVSRFLNGFPYKETDPYDPGFLHRSLEDLEEKIGISYDDTQIEAIDCFFQNPITILTGGPGTGKTTVVRAMVQLFTLMYPASTVVCAAPTGRAAKRLSELTGADSATIHSLLRWDLETNTFRKNEEDPILADLLIIDEFSMVDTWLFSNLLKASANVRKICILGDEDQLPSVGPGCVLRDMIACGRFPLIRLEKIHRQERGSGVIMLARDINQGKCEDQYSDVAMIDCRRTDIKQILVQVIRNAFDKGYTLDDIQVLSPMYSGAAGIDVLNNTLQMCFNPPDETKREYKIGYTTFREGDKILQLKNQPDDDVYNGDIGILTEIVRANESENNMVTLVVEFDGIYVEYTQENWNNISLAYCISIHKSQGSEYPIVIMPFTWQMNVMLQRKLIYTGATRARKALIILGETGAFRKGIEILEKHPRETTLTQRLIRQEDSFLLSEEE